MSSLLFDLSQRDCNAKTSLLSFASPVCCNRLFSLLGTLLIEEEEEGEEKCLQKVIIVVFLIDAVFVL